ncbi:hypothetical protein [Caldivirga maquilingensis]|uniref:Uncharacterized protein n=1 Tax=Caldivirga maquilingensis (strain ATCC 700844 / DSM 13496 / JCM 10307 / IC-167) TaxID=397948 RepID=A8MDL0_CALMQ|nr:hypothetical protein [Caldivirga maquilingensis]ABW01866.1 hypothetical protein Cmaq_1037 [Caldivirga maquilingensis IC-167]
MIKLNCDDAYWDLRNRLEVACGPLSMFRRIMGIGDTDDVAVHVSDIDAVPGGLRVFKVGVVGFSNRAVYIGGLPHVSLEDFIASLPLNSTEYWGLVNRINLTQVNIPLILRLAEEAGTLKGVIKLLKDFNLSKIPTTGELG